ncbi:hypothetical protein COU00_00770 [Candidatus Falkowbacteria bacterium CG10_big_fil_rev_8_21_14_0_10_43_11]|uniref:Uncharacterized protein n=1 Tax=Candidatus Falkowbacteria bacterium CG10_big_fil_rev_8_21_14_0_10_43_11 TaxID=1974568 RepID=A0A2M6WMT0_9BACT|nr:MAG: hypothetical protein COU00_00770 [Candidatus Falkowbacteria bacterium CG10_big_fil_rev_8_21_14_0_10_43_11]
MVTANSSEQIGTPLIFALVEYQTDEELTLSFDDADLGYMLLDIKKTADTPEIQSKSKVVLQRVIEENGDINYILLPQTVLPPDPADDILADLKLTFPKQPDNYDDPQQLKRNTSELKKAFGK